jgi:pimeloyl-ACP methyl ester carboxylesterase
MPLQSPQATPGEIHYRTVDVAGIEIFYREAGSPKAPTILLLHGFPTSSHMFRELIPLLADRSRLARIGRSGPQFPSQRPTP